MRVSKKPFFAAAFFLLTAQLSFVMCQDDESECYDELGRATRCVSPRRSFSFEQRPQANSTCGSPPAMFCSREVNALLSTVSSNCDQVCNASDAENAHPPELMTDFILNVDSWWQSENSFDTQNTVVIDLPFDTLVEVSVIAIDFRSIIPSAFRILKSKDFGQTFVPFHFFASSCTNTYGINPDRVLTFNTETELLCQQVPIPTTTGQISFFPAQHRPSSNDSVPGFSEALYNFITATDIQIILEEHSPIDDLPPNDFGYYYAIEDLNVVGSCQCYGHASSCSRNPITDTFQCNCQHNTTGTYCERCSDFYQDVPWSRADGNGFQECKACNCNNHSVSCVFDQEVYEQSGQVSGGVCLNCTGNTSGRQCERCIELYYPQPGLPLSHPNICVACDCNLDGVTKNGTCAQEVGPNGLQLGDCSCKQNTQGRTCSQCIEEHFNLSATNPLGCQECLCNATGSTSLNCNQETGLCTCKPNVVGDKCEECRFGFYHSDPSSAQGCQPCSCNLGGSLSEQCDIFTGQCPCRTGVTGLTCSETIPGYFFPSIDFLILEAEGSSTNDTSGQVIEISGENTRFTGTGFYRATESTSTLSLGSLTPPISGQYEIVLRYNLREAIRWESVTVRVEPISRSSNILPADCGTLQELNGNTQLNFTSLMMGVGLTVSQRACLRGGYAYSFELSDFISGQSSGVVSLDVDSVVLILVEASNLRDFQLSSDYAECVDSWRSLLTQSSASPSCEQTIFSVSTAAYNGTLECDCDPIGAQMGSVCQPFGGQCLCLPGIRGRQCDECSPGFFNLTHVGCTRCQCDVSLSQNVLCDIEDGQCECSNNTVGRDCSTCAADHWLGYDSDNGCVPCACDVTGSITTQCNVTSGECQCKDGVDGSFCDQCSTLHFGFSDNGCSQCNCSDAGSTSVNCNVDDGQCSCKLLTDGRDCSECQSGTFNLQLSNPDGCQTCFCSGQSNTCSFAEGFVHSTISSNFNEPSVDPLQGWTVVNTTGFLLNSQFSQQFSNEGIDVAANSEVYLQSPVEFLGNRLSSYGQFIELSYNTNYSNTYPTLPYDVVISGNGLELGTLFTSNITGPGSVPILIQLHEAMGWLDTATNTPVTAVDIQLVLSSLDNLMITGSYNQDITLRSISIDVAIPSSDTSLNADVVTWVEQCECPTNYTGLSCEQCANGYTRTPTGSCELCQCNGFSNTCDQNTGECFNCSQSTTGQNCELCIEGTFGDPSIGIICEPCPCPLSDGAGQFTNDCVLISGGDVVCLNCPEGHTGLQCETCINGFYGDPTGNVTGLPTGCSDCLCNGNIDTSIPDSCNQVTGLCIRCINNTTGNQCEQCAVGFYGDAIVAKNCTVCECDPEGSSGICDASDGTCDCYPNIIGRQCEQCAPGHYGLTRLSGCQPCNCQVGAVSMDCNDDGQCTCQPGVTGATCDQCLPGFYGLSPSGCEECSCSQINAETTTCDANGQCICRPGSTGSECEECLFNFYLTPQGCTACPTCYQELKEQLNNTHEQLDMNARDIQALLNVISSTGFTRFDSRLLLEQQSVDNILQQAQALAGMEDESLELYRELLVLINQTLVTQITQTNASLDDLKAFSTTVFVLATTSMELVNYTIRDILQTQEILNVIENVILPSVVRSVSTIQDNLADGRESVEELMSNMNLLYQQMDVLSNISNTISIITTTVMQNIEHIEMVVNDTTNVLDNIIQLQLLVDIALSPLTGRSQSVGLQLMTLASQIQEELDSLVSVPSAEYLGAILSNANASESFAMNLKIEISNSQNYFNSLNTTLTDNQQELGNLQSRLISIEEDIRSLLYETQDAQFRGLNAQSLAYSIIEDGELILENLRNFSNNSMQVAVQAAIALQVVSRITTSAQTALKTAENIEERIRAIQDIVTTAKVNTMNASNTISEAEQNIREINTTLLLSSVEETLNSSLTSQEMARSLSAPVATVFDNFQNQSTRIDQTVPSFHLARNQTIDSSSLRNEALSIVQQLENRLDSLSGTDQQTFESIEQFLMTLEQEITDADIENMYNVLRLRLDAQMVRRQGLEHELDTIQPTLEHLRHISSTLPNLDCDG